MGHGGGISPCLALPGCNHNFLLKDHSSSNGKETEEGGSQFSVLFKRKKAVLALLVYAVHSTFQRSGKLYPLSFGADASVFMVPLSWCSYRRFPTWSFKVRDTIFYSRGNRRPATLGLWRAVIFENTLWPDRHLHPPTSCHAIRLGPINCCTKWKALTCGILSGAIDQHQNCIQKLGHYKSS